MSRGIIWLLAISTGCIVANIYYAQPLLADIAREFGLSVTQVGAVFMLTQIGMGTGMLIFVPLGDKYERRQLISTLLVAASLALAFTASSPNVVWLSVASFVVGLTASTVQVIVPFAAHHAPERERGRIVGTVLGGLLVGALLARTFSGVFGAAYGWRTVYWVASVLMIGLAAVIRLALPGQPAPGIHALDEADAIGPGPGPRAPGSAGGRAHRRASLLLVRRAVDDAGVPAQDAAVPLRHGCGRDVWPAGRGERRGGAVCRDACRIGRAASARSSRPSS